MGLLEFLALLERAETLDRTTKPVEYSGLKLSGLIFTLAGGALVVLSLIVERQFSCGAALGLLCAAIGCLLLLLYGLGAKRYGAVAVGMIVVSILVMVMIAAFA